MSIRLRLTVWYVGVLAVLLIAFDLLVYSVLGFGLQAEAQRTIQGRTQVVATYIREKNDPLFLLVSGLVKLPPIDVFSSPGVYVQIVWSDGAIVSRSDNLGDQQLPVNEANLTACFVAISRRRPPWLGPHDCCFTVNRSRSVGKSSVLFRWGSHCRKWIRPFVSPPIC